MKKLALSCAIAGAMMSLCASVQAAEPIDPIEPVEVKNPALVELGKMLFFEPRLSRSGFISCNSCHNLATGGVDNLQTSIGDRWAQGPINSPTVLNSFGQVAQFWDGRAKTLAEQAAGPIANPLEMASTPEMASIPGYAPYFKRPSATLRSTSSASPKPWPNLNARSLPRTLDSTSGSRVTKTQSPSRN